MNDCTCRAVPRGLGLRRRQQRRGHRSQADLDGVTRSRSGEVGGFGVGQSQVDRRRCRDAAPSRSRRARPVVHHDACGNEHQPTTRQRSRTVGAAATSRTRRRLPTTAPTIHCRAGQQQRSAEDRGRSRRGRRSRPAAGTQPAAAARSAVRRRTPTPERSAGRSRRRRSDRPPTSAQATNIAPAVG